MNEEELTPLQIWLHPKRTAARVQQLQCDLQQALEQADKTRQSLEAEISDLKKSRSVLQAENTELSLKYKHLEEDYTSQETQIAEIEAMFKHVEALKAQYDKRIDKYKCRIADLERTLRRVENAGNNDIEPLPPLPKPSVSPKPAKPAPPDDADPSADWYHPLDL